MLGLLAVSFTSWFASIQWRRLLFVGYGLLVASLTYSALQSHDLSALVGRLVFFQIVTGALTPWEGSWQLALDAGCADDASSLTPNTVALRQGVCRCHRFSGPTSPSHRLVLQLPNMHCVKSAHFPARACAWLRQSHPAIDEVFSW